MVPAVVRHQTVGVEDLERQGGAGRHPFLLVAAPLRGVEATPDLARDLSLVVIPSLHRRRSVARDPSPREVVLGVEVEFPEDETTVALGRTIYTIACGENRTILASLNLILLGHLFAFYRYRDRKNLILLVLFPGV